MAVKMKPWCPWCQQYVIGELRPDGTMKNHRDNGEPCEGSRQLPTPRKALLIQSSTNGVKPWHWKAST